MAQQIIEAYCLKTKKKEVMVKPVIVKQGNRYMAQGATAEGHKMSLIMNEENAKAAIATGIPTEERAPKAKKEKKAKA